MEQQKMEKIAIITTDKKLAELCEAECILCGYNAEIFVSAQALRSSFTRYLWDIDTVPDISKMSEKSTIRMSREKDFFEDKQSIRIPPTLKNLHHLISNFSKEESSYECDIPKALVLKNRETRTILFGDRFTELSEHEFKVLEYLCKNRSKPVKREEINLILGAERGNISDVYIYHLRKKLEDLCGNRMISTVRSKGYMIDIDLVEK
jgi:hypothetical protein